MKILDAGTSVLDDRDVLAYIHSKHAAHKAFDASSKEANRSRTKRPGNFVRALKKHQEHLEHAERPFINNEHYDGEGQYAGKLMERLEPRVQLTKTELLMLVNHRPHVREFLLPMVEDIDSRVAEEDQDWIVEQVIDILGRPAPPKKEEEEEDGDAQMEG